MVDTNSMYITALIFYVGFKFLCITGKFIFNCFFCSLFQSSTNTILQKTVRREALNGVYDIDTVKVVTPAVLVWLVCGWLWPCDSACCYSNLTKRYESDWGGDHWLL